MRFLRAQKFEERLLYQLDKILWQEGYLDEIEERIKKISRQDPRAQPSALGNLTNELLSLEGEIDDAFRLQARVSDASTDEIFRQRWQKIQERKKSVEFQIAGIKSMSEIAQDPAAQLEVIENNLIAFKKARGGANRQQLKRLISEWSNPSPRTPTDCCCDTGRPT